MRVGEHQRVGVVEEVPALDVVYEHPVGLDAVVEEPAIGARERLVVDVEMDALTEQELERERLVGHEEADVALDRARLAEEPRLLRRVGPLREPAHHGGAPVARAVVAVEAVGAEQRAVEQRSPARAQDPGRPAAHRGERPDPHVRGADDAAVLFGPSRQLRVAEGVDPHGPALELGVPERLAAAARTHQVHGLHQLPGLGRVPLLHVGQAVGLDLGGRAPLVGAAEGVVVERRGLAVRADQRVGVNAPDQVDPPLHVLVEGILAEGDPVQALGIGRERPRRLHLRPVGVAVAAPGLRDPGEVAVLRAQPAAEALPGRGAVTVPAVVALVVHVVAEQPFVPAVPADHLGEEPAAELADGRAVEAEAGVAARRAAGAHGAGHRRAVGARVASFGMQRVQPLRRADHHLGDDRADAVPRAQVQLPVVVVPVVDARRDLDGPPHEPVAEDVDPVLARGPVVALPVVAGRVGFAKVDGSERELRDVALHPRPPRGRGRSYHAPAPTDAGFPQWTARSSLTPPQPYLIILH